MDLPLNVSFPFLGVGLVTILISICFCCYLWRLKYAGRLESRGYKRVCYLSKKLMNETCAVCLDEFKLKEKVCQLQVCKHGFHEKCLLAWLVQKNTCPLCQQPVSKRVSPETGQYGTMPTSAL
ncbi:unnamed protein product [Owenia fusiformis]|uniref:Uncharacterized protein n=1 Tax=Owenia fusiformis TaxID=6347 RepID=A0A8J1T4B2_OWEFU|nr:unnamed protein product [Owenia fusiformis]